MNIIDCRVLGSSVCLLDFQRTQGTSCCSLFAQRDEEEGVNEKHGEGREH